MSESYKIVVLGENQVGKSTLISQFNEDDKDEKKYSQIEVNGKDLKVEFIEL
jgi:GTPase SAR1 family protein